MAVRGISKEVDINDNPIPIPAEAGHEVSVCSNTTKRKNGDGYLLVSCSDDVQFRVDSRRLAEKSDFFKALADSQMKETRDRSVPSIDVCLPSSFFIRGCVRRSVRPSVPCYF